MSIGKLLRTLEKHGCTLSSRDGQLIVAHDDMISPEDREAMTEHTPSLIAVLRAWRYRHGWPRIPNDLSWTSRFVMVWPHTIRVAWEARAVAIGQRDVPPPLAKWCAYLQMIDTLIELDLESRRPMLPQLQRLKAVNDAMHGMPYDDPRLVDLHHERHALESWIDANTPNTP